MTTMRLLITGIPGFVGSHMAEYALSKGTEVVGSARWRSRTENIEPLRGKVQLVECDLRDSASVRRLLTTSTPNNTVGQVNPLEVTRDLKTARPFLVSD